jgi:hypothetical protein
MHELPDSQLPKLPLTDKAKRKLERTKKTQRLEKTGGPARGDRCGDRCGVDMGIYHSERMALSNHMIRYMVFYMIYDNDNHK